MIKKDKKLEFVKSRSRRKYKKENDHINKETSKTKSEDSSKFLHYFALNLAVKYRTCSKCNPPQFIFVL